MKRHTIAYVLLGVVVAAAVVAAVYVKLYSSGSLAAYDNVPVSAAQIRALEAIAGNYSLAASVGRGIVGAPLTQAGGNGNNDGPFNLSASSQLVINGTPYVVYVGAEYCPYCAVTRWGLILALMRFGNFSSLHYMTSSATDAYPNTATFTLYNVSYSSRYIGFMEAETLTNKAPYKQLQALNGMETSTFDAYNLYNNALPSQDRGGIPFIDFGNYSAQVGAPVSPQVIQHMSWNKTISELYNPDSAPAQAIIGTANVYTAAICKMTGNMPSSVCGRQFIRKLE